jgi:hypothetical protein
MTPLAQRYAIAQSWWIATELVRRHPELTIVETHPGGGQYDVLEIVRDGASVISLNRAGRIHITDSSQEPLEFEATFGESEPRQVIEWLEHASRLSSPDGAAASTGKVLAYRALAHIVWMTAHQATPLDVRSEFLDSSGGGGSGPRGLLARFPIAHERSRESRPDDPAGIPAHRYWLVMKGPEALAAADVDGFVYTGESCLSLSTLYAENGRSMSKTVIAALGPLLP